MYVNGEISSYLSYIIVNLTIDKYITIQTIQRKKHLI